MCVYITWLSSLNFKRLVRSEPLESRFLQAIVNYVLSSQEDIVVDDCLLLNPLNLDKSRFHE